MSELSNSIKRLAEKFPGSTSELARQVRIDRSTLYKIMGGRRLPTEAQLQNLLSVLHATPAEYTALTHLYAHSQQTGAAAHRQQLLQALLSSAFRAQRIIQEANSLLESGGTPLSAPAFLQGEELRTFLPQRLRSRQQRRLTVPSFPSFGHCLLRAFCCRLPCVRFSFPASGITISARSLCFGAPAA